MDEAVRRGLPHDFFGFELGLGVQAARLRRWLVRRGFVDRSSPGCCGRRGPARSSSSRKSGGARRGAHTPPRCCACPRPCRLRYSNGPPFMAAPTWKTNSHSLHGAVRHSGVAQVAVDQVCRSEGKRAVEGGRRSSRRRGSLSSDAQPTSPAPGPGSRCRRLSAYARRRQAGPPPPDTLAYPSSARRETPSSTVMMRRPSSAGRRWRSVVQASWNFSTET